LQLAVIPILSMLFPQLVNPKPNDIPHCEACIPAARRGQRSALTSAAAKDGIDLKRMQNVGISVLYSELLSPLVIQFVALNGDADASCRRRAKSIDVNQITDLIQRI
jgi:hypothetical protein